MKKNLHILGLVLAVIVMSVISTPTHAVILGLGIVIGVMLTKILEG